MNVKRLIFFSMILLLMFYSTSCNNKPAVVVEEEKPPTVTIKEIPSPIFTPEEEGYINELKKKGHINVAACISPGSFEVDSDGGFSGFQYDFALEFAEFLDLELEIQSVLFSDIFSKDGIIPDIFKTVDLCAGFFTILP